MRKKTAPAAPLPDPADDLIVEQWPIGRPQPYPGNARKLTDRAVDLLAESIRQFGFRQPIVCDAQDVIVVGHTRLMAAQKLELSTVPVHVAANLTPAQCRAYRLMDNRTADETTWDPELLQVEMAEMQAQGIELDLTGFDARQITEILASAPLVPEDEAPPPPDIATSRTGDIWLLGNHRVACGDCTDPAVVASLLREDKPFLMVTDPPYGIELDSEWRDRAGLNGHGAAEPSYLKKRTKGHTETTISGDTRADWSAAFALVPSLQVAYVWHASKFTREVLDGLLGIGFLHHQQIIWDKGRTVLTRTHYWFQHEPCWYVRKKNAPWFGKAGKNSTVWSPPAIPRAFPGCGKGPCINACRPNGPVYGPPGENSTVWSALSPKFIMGGSDEDKFDHPTQKPVELMRKSILNHTKPCDLVYEPFIGSGTTLAAAQVTGRVCLGIEIDPKYADVAVQRWQGLTGKQATLEGDGRTFAEVKTARAAD